LATDASAERSRSMGSMDDHPLSLSRRRFLERAVMGAAGATLASAGRAGAAVEPPPAASTRDVMVFEGTFHEISGGMIHLDVEGSPASAVLAPDSSYWRGADVGKESLRVRDDVMMHVRAGHLVRAWANLFRVRGVVTGRSGGNYVVRGGSGYGPASDLGLDFSASTSFVDGTSGERKTLKSLATGTMVDAIGLMDDDVLHATLLTYVIPNTRLRKLSQAAPASIERTTVDTPTGALALCNTTYYGYASWFNCSASLAKCQRCSYSSGGACAWPNVSPNCNFTSGCKGQSQAWCGKDIDVRDRCVAQALPCAVVDCGPCQAGNCSPHTCGVVCGDCASGSTAVVDLTRSSFSLFYDPTRRGCFSCRVINTISC
jgi:hypothetical protein